MIVEHSSDPSWISVMTAFAGPITGIVTAIVVTRLTYYYSERSAVARQARENQEQLRREAVVRSETTRVESLKRELTSLESFARSVIGMSEDVSALSNAALDQQDSVWQSAYRNEKNFQEADAINAIYFSERTEPQWTEYKMQYRQCWLDATHVAKATRLAFGQIPNDEGLGHEQRILRVSQANDVLQVAIGVMFRQLQPLLQKITLLAGEIRRG